MLTPITLLYFYLFSKTYSNLPKTQLYKQGEVCWDRMSTWSRVEVSNEPCRLGLYIMCIMPCLFDNDLDSALLIGTAHLYHVSCLNVLMPCRATNFFMNEFNAPKI